MANNYGFKVFRFEETPASLWDKWVSRIGGSSYLHSSSFLGFLHEMVGPDKALSFACIQDEEHPLALCPAAVCKNNLFGNDFLDASWNGAPLGGPVFAEQACGVGDKIKNQVFELFHGLIREKGAKRCYIRRHPVSLDLLSGKEQLEAFQFYPLKLGYECHPQNTIVIDLRVSGETLSAGLSQYQRKHIRRSSKKGIRIAEYNSSTEKNGEIFNLYQQAHIKSAGKMTRPQRSFDVMLEAVNNGSAALFVAFAEDIAISFLYCGEFHKFAFGWSQVNLDEFEKMYSPRHLLEWEAMMAYKKRGFCFYELGTFWGGPQLYKIPTSKELSIAEFKRRYGGLWLPELCFERFFDKELYCQVHQSRLDNFMSSGYFNE